MQNVIRKLKEFSTQIDLKKRFDFNFDVSDKIFSSAENKRLKTHNNPFDQNVELKWILSEKYQSNSEQNFIDFWIINVWGGIRGFKPNEKNIDKISRFKKQIEKGRLSLDCFSTISSLSKVSSFLHPEKFVIYDSRVIYTLNWLILTCENQNGLIEKYYPMPSGRNRIIADFDMNTIINVSHLPEYMDKSELFISQQQAYFDFCNLIKKATIETYGENAKPYELEMLLFTLADKEIFTELKNTLKITTGNNVYKT
ncbi:hypothetical protein [Winogradskyella immobilis]|uniref:Uncharacterized protein n=1 Tax=Winogradskyella immobilis TaxID=2816852 RepID=A0ABS8EQX5_9FLAO|nr:hypothetical protein [Winogradskyella immobilis]MCC1485633.1 hypothetical protein [Winogradskyella immobilis]MCG0017725.1 hypothetical protein [Winogradskyella immobilis]